MSSSKSKKQRETYWIEILLSKELGKFFGWAYSKYHSVTVILLCGVATIMLSILRGALCPQACFVGYIEFEISFTSIFILMFSFCQYIWIIGLIPNEWMNEWIVLCKNRLHVGVPYRTGIRGLMRGMATLSQGNQELLVVRDKVGRPPGEFGVSKSTECDIFPSVLWLGDRKGIWPVKNWMLVCLVVIIWLELCTTYSSSSPVVTTTSIILCFNKDRLTQFHLENGR